VCLREVAAHATIAAAATALDFTPSAVSQQIAERDLHLEESRLEI
jgi:DNA-binding transcriptional LysR family regulator